jgi:hypothetical protein
MKMEQTECSESRHIKFRRRGIIQKKPYNIQNTAKVWNQECFLWFFFCGQDTVGCTATRHGLDGPGNESRWQTIFSAPVQTGPGNHPASYTTGIGSFPWVKRLRCGADHPPPSSAEVKERVELYVYPLYVFMAFYFSFVVVLSGLNWRW